MNCKHGSIWLNIVPIETLWKCIFCLKNYLANLKKTLLERGTEGLLQIFIFGFTQMKNMSFIGKLWYWLTNFQKSLPLKPQEKCFMICDLYKWSNLMLIGWQKVYWCHILYIRNFSCVSCYYICNVHFAVKNVLAEN